GSGGSGRGLGGAEDGADDLVVAGAAAEVAGECEAELALARARVAIEVGFGAHQEAGGAEAALEPAGLDEGALEGVELAVDGEALDRRDGVAFGLGGEHQARVDGQAVDQDRAGAAVAVAAAFLGAEEAQLVAQ